MPERLTYSHFSKENTQASTSAVSSTSSSLNSPHVKSTSSFSAIRSSTRRQEILQTFDEISRLSQKLQISMDLSNSIMDLLERQHSPDASDTIPTTVYHEVNSASSISSVGRLEYETPTSSSDGDFISSDITPHPVEVTQDSPPSSQPGDDLSPPTQPSHPPQAVRLHESTTLLNDDKNTYDDTKYQRHT